MPLLLCPNDNSSMQSINRSGVEFDMCPTCRGVWLDRGELEKLLGAAREGQGEAPRAAPPPQGYAPQGYAARDREYGDRRHDDDYRRRKRKGGFDLFDIFD